MNGSYWFIYSLTLTKEIVRRVCDVKNGHRVTEKCFTMSDYIYVFSPFWFLVVGGEQISAIGRGICVLLGISVEDTQKELEHM